MNLVYYIELLANLRQLQITLAFDNDTTISIQVNQDHLVVTDGSKAAHIVPLPARVAPKKSSIDDTLKREFSIVLPIVQETSSQGASIPPLTAPQLNALQDGTFNLSCRQCDAVLLPKSIDTFKDLPSEHWAELMECWLCHKAPGTDQYYDPAVKASTSQILAQETVGLVGATYFLLHSKDIQNLKILPFPDGSQSKLVPTRPVECQQCQQALGICIDDETSVRLFKAAIKAQGFLKDGSFLRDYPVTLTLSNVMLEESTAHACRRFLLREDTEKPRKDIALIWLFTTDSKIATNAAIADTFIPKELVSLCSDLMSSNKVALDVTKLLFMPFGTNSAIEQSWASDKTSVEEILLPPRACKEVMTRLRASTYCLPSSKRSLNGFSVGLIERW